MIPQESSQSFDRAWAIWVGPERLAFEIERQTGGRHWMQKKFESDGKCFVCGKENPGGLRLLFEIDKEKKVLRTTFLPGPVFQGYDGVVHGGIISTLLDEAMAKLAYELGYNAVTASLEIRFRKPASILKRLKIYGEITEVNRRIVRSKAHVSTEDGTILAVGTSTLMRQG